MKQLKQLREAFGYSKKDLAERFGTTQKMITLWEQGSAEPDLKILRDMAILFGLSVDDFLGTNPLTDDMPSIYMDFSREKRINGFWGHVGLLFTGSSKTQWFPITKHTFHEIEAGIQTSGWIYFYTLANKVVAFRPKALRKLSLLDDACDEPKNDWNLHLPYRGLPAESYRAFEYLNDVAYDAEKWQEVVESMPLVDDKGNKSGNSEKWTKFSAELAEALEGEVSEEFVIAVVHDYVDLGLHKDEDLYFQTLYHTNIYTCDGHVDTGYIEAECIASFIQNIESEFVEDMLRFEHDTGNLNYYPQKNISAIVMPMCHLIDGMKELGCRQEN